MIAGYTDSSWVWTVDDQNNNTAPFALRIVNAQGSEAEKRSHGFYTGQFWITHGVQITSNILDSSTLSSISPGSSTRQSTAGSSASSTQQPTTTNSSSSPQQPTTTGSVSSLQQPTTTASVSNTNTAAAVTTSSSSGLSSSSSIGIGVGVGMGVAMALVAVGAFLFGRRRRRQRGNQQQQEKQQYCVTSQTSGVVDQHKNNDSYVAPLTHFTHAVPSSYQVHEYNSPMLAEAPDKAWRVPGELPGSLPP